jgi:LEA14-like dessication related protein
MKNVIWIALAAGAVLLYTRIRALTNLQFVARNIGFGGGGIQLQVGVQNPTSTDLTLKSIFGQFIVNGSPVGNVSSSYQQIVKGNSETTVLVTISPDIFGSVGLLVNQLQTGVTAPETIELRGQANVNDNIVPLRLTFM